jgi:hypothetical protein
VLSRDDSLSTGGAARFGVVDGEKVGQPIRSSRRRIQFEITVASQPGWARQAAASRVTP